MLSRFLRYVINLMVLATVSVAGLPIILCVSQSHGMAVEFEQPYADHQDNPQSHFVLFGGAKNFLQPLDCIDFHLDRGTLAKESREGEPKSYLSSKDAPVVFAEMADFPVGTARHASCQGQIWTFASTLRSSISDLGTVILLI